MTPKFLSPYLDDKLGPLTFGEFLRVARENMDCTQVELARKLKITRGTLCDIEKGRQLVSVSLAKKIAVKAGLSIEVAIQACLQDQLRKVGLKHQVKLIA